MIQTEFRVDAAHGADLDLDDFVRLVLNAPTARLVWVRVVNCRRGFILDVFRRVWPDIVLRLGALDRFIEIR